VSTTLSRQAADAKPQRHRRLGLWYRAGWRFNYVMLGVYGPAQLGGDGQPDPRVLMRQERADRARALSTTERPARRMLR